MNATRALEISLESRQTAIKESGRTRANTFTRLRMLPEYTAARDSVDDAPALSAIDKAASAGLTTCSYNVRREVRQPTAADAASALGEATGVIYELERLGYNTELGSPYCTHDRDGDNGVNVVVHIQWGDDG